MYGNRIAGGLQQCSQASCRVVGRGTLLNCVAVWVRAIIFSFNFISVKHTYITIRSGVKILY